MGRGIEEKGYLTVYYEAYILGLEFSIYFTKLPVKLKVSCSWHLPFHFILGAYALGSIDPSLYKIVDEDDTYEIPVDHIGRLWFAVEYERETEKLLVTLIKSKNLPTRQYGNNSSCDPFVR